MALPDVFDPVVSNELCDRIGRLLPTSKLNWGRMNAAQMLAHCCTPYEQLRGEKGGGPAPMRWIARVFFKKAVVGEAPFKQNLPTPKSFVVADAREFERERGRLLDCIRTHHGEGRAAFEGRVHVTFGPLSACEWSNLFWKHLDHHFRQFGV